MVANRLLVVNALCVCVCTLQLLSAKDESEIGDLLKMEATWAILQRADINTQVALFDCIMRRGPRLTLPYIYSGTSVWQPPLGDKILASIEGCPHFRGWICRSFLGDIMYCP